jgi:hypothetical protein
VENTPARPDTLEFIEAISDFSNRDRFAIRVLLEEVKTTAEKKGEEAALAILDRACPRPNSLKVAVSAS